jgi:hypothetical protein
MIAAIEMYQTISRSICIESTFIIKSILGIYMAERLRLYLIITGLCAAFLHCSTL